MDLSGLYIKGTGTYEVKEWAFTPGWVDTGEIDQRSDYTTVDAVFTHDASGYYRFTFSSPTQHLYKAFAFVAGHRYKFTWEFRSTDLPATVMNIRTRLSAGGSGVDILTTPVVVNDGEWQTWEIIFTATGAANGLNIYSTFTSSGENYDFRKFHIEELPPLPGFDSGTKYLECTTAGTVAIPSDQAYGEWEFEIYKGADGNYFIVDFITDVLTNVNGYRLQFNNAEAAQLSRMINGSGGAGVQWATASSYIDINIWYRVKITRTLDGEFYTYIRGGEFGNDDWTLIDVTGGSGTNPATDTTYTESKYFVFDLDAGDRIANIIMRKAVQQ